MAPSVYGSYGTNGVRSSGSTGFLWQHFENSAVVFICVKC